jgi:hypothetical protein
MAFRATFNNLADINGTDQSAFDFINGGVLAIRHGNETFYFAPGTWRHVTTPDAHRPGGV